MVQVCKDDVISIFDAVGIKSDRSDVARVRVGKANSRFAPGIGKGRHLPRRTFRQTDQRDRFKRRLLDKSQGRRNGSTHIFRRELCVRLRLLQILMELGNAGRQLLLQRQHLLRTVTTHTLHIGIEPTRLAEHGILNLCAQNAADTAEVFANRIHLAGGAEEIFAIADDITRCKILRGIRVKPLAHGMPDVDRLRALSVAINTPVTLLHHVRIPRNLDVNHVLAEIVEVDALGRGVRCQENAHWRGLARLGLKRIDDGISVFARERSVQLHQQFATITVVSENGLEPCVRIHELGEENDALVIHLAIRTLQMSVKPFENRLGLRVL